MNFAKFLRTPSLTEHLQWLLLTPAQMFICNFSESFKNTTVTTSYSLGRYPKTYLDTILKGSNDIN